MACITRIVVDFEEGFDQTLKIQITVKATVIAVDIEEEVPDIG
jgi:hypothetical protein